MEFTQSVTCADQNQDTFFGIPWIYRTRQLLETVGNLQEAQQYWSSTNNTCGFNFLVASAADLAAGSQHPAMVLETEAGYTAQFLDNDPREAQATYVNKQGEVVQMGKPMKEVQ